MTEPAEKEETFGDRVTKIYLRMHKADKRNTGMRLNYQEVGDLAFALSNQIADVVYGESKS